MHVCFSPPESTVSERRGAASLARVFRALRQKQSRNRLFNSAFSQNSLRHNFIAKIMTPLALKAGFAPATLFAAISLLDAFLSLRRVPDEQLPSAGVVALSLASKLHEVCYIGLEKAFFADMRACLDPGGLLRMERLMLATLGFDLRVATPWHFVELFLEMGAVLGPGVLLGTADLKAILFRVLLSFSLDYRVNKFKSLSVALCAVMVVRKALGLAALVPQPLRALTQFNEGELSSTFSFCLAQFEWQSRENARLFESVPLRRTGAFAA